MTDLYAGVGLFGLAHAGLGRGDVIAVEGDAGRIEDLQANAEPYADRVRVEARSVEEALRHRARSMVGRWWSTPPDGIVARGAGGAGRRPPAAAWFTFRVTSRPWPATRPRLAAAGYDAER